MKISDHISYREAVKSVTAIRRDISNKPNQRQLENMRFVADTVFEPLRKALGNKPIGIASFYRSPLLNRIIGGSPDSQHTKGEAMDIDADILENGVTNREIFEWIYNNANFDQLIWEFGNEHEPDWVHVSKTKHGNRGEALVAYRDKQVKYRYYEP